VEGGGLGVRQGFQIGQEIGYYSGCTQMWRYLDSKSPGFLHPRAEKVVSALEQLLISFPLQDPKVSRKFLHICFVCFCLGFLKSGFLKNTFDYRRMKGSKS
jgi:hypothetical protein